MPSRPFMRFQRPAYREGGVDLRWYLDDEDSPESIPVRVYRRRFPDFDRPEDREGFFDGLQPDEADLHFEGDLDRSGKKLAYRDESVEVYETYAYWINRPGLDTPPLGPNPVRIRDPDSFTYRGPAPESEPETRAIVSFVEDATPETVLATHYMGSICGAAMQAAEAEHDDAYREACRDIAEAYTEGMYGADRELILRWVHSAGSLKTWLHEAYGLPGFALEDDGAPNAELGRQDRTTPELLETYRDRHYGGVVSLLERLAGK